MHDAVVSKLIAASRGSPCDSMASCLHCLFVCSPYCMHEFEVAVYHNIVVKRKRRVIVLMALDSPTDFCANEVSDTVSLRQYLRQYTYIDYTADDWLDKLLYALPLNGMGRDEESFNPDDDDDDIILLQ